MSDFFEKTLEDIVFENKETICERGFPFLLDNTLRQFVLPSDKKIDLFSFSISENSIQCKIFELKRECLKTPHVLQVLDYSTEVYSHLYPHFENIFIERIIIGNDIDKQTVSLVEDILNFETYLYRYVYNGLFFKKYLGVHEMDRTILDKIAKPDEHNEKFNFRLHEIDKNRTH